LQRRPQPAEGADVPAEALGFVRQIEPDYRLGRPNSPVSVVLADRGNTPVLSRDGTPSGIPDGRQTRESAIHSVGSSWGQENWAQDLDSDLGDLAHDNDTHLRAHSAEELGMIEREGSNLSILGPAHGRRSRGASQAPRCAPGSLPQGLIVDQQSVLDHEVAAAKRDVLYTEEQVGRSKSKEELACYRGAAIKVKEGAKIRDEPASGKSSGQPRAGRRAAGPRAASAMAVLQTLEDELDPPLADLPFPWVKERDPWLDGTSKLMAPRPGSIDEATGSVAVLDDVLKKDSATTKPSEMVVIHHASRYQREKGSADIPVNAGRCEQSSSVPLTVEKLNNQDYVLTTAGVVSQTATGHGEFMPMPEWLQESTYLKASKGRFNLSLWAVFNKLYHTTREQKYQRTRKIVGSRCMCFRPTFRQCLREVVTHCAEEATQPSSKLIQPKRHGRSAMGEFQKTMKEQRVLAHESFVQMMEKLSRLIERVISEVKAGEMRQRAKDIEQAEKDEIYRWKKHGKDAAKLPGMPGSKQYGPNNRLHPKAPKISELHKPLEVESDSVLMPRFIRLCDFLTAYCVTFILDSHFSYFLNTLTSTIAEDSYNLEYFRTAVTFKAPDEVTAERKQAQVVQMLGQLKGQDDDELQPTLADGSWTQVYFVPRQNTVKDNLSKVLEDFVAVFDAPRLLFYESFQEQVKSIVSFHEMNQVQGIQDIVPLNFVTDGVKTAHSAVTQSYSEAKRLCLEVFDGMDEFWLFANKKVKDLQASATVQEVAQLPGMLRMCHQWRRKIMDLATQKHGTYVSTGVLWVDGVPLEKELMEMVEMLFREAQNAVERVIDNEAMQYCAEMEKLTNRILPAVQNVLDCREDMMPRERLPVDPNESDGGYSSDGNGIESSEKLAARRAKREVAIRAFEPPSDHQLLPQLEDAESKLFSLSTKGWDMLGHIRAKTETLDKMVLWLMKPIHWLPNQMTMKIEQPMSTMTSNTKKDSWGGLAALKAGKTYAKQAGDEEIDSGDDDTVYIVTVHTCDQAGAGTDSAVSIEIHGKKGSLGGKRGEPMMLTRELLQEGDTTENLFERGQSDVFALPPMQKLGKLKEVTVMSDGEGFGASWMLDSIEVTDTRAEQTWTFPCNGWLDGGVPNTLKVQVEEGGSNSPLKKTSSNHTKTGLSKLRGMVAPTAHEETPQPGVRSVRAKIRAKTWGGPKLTRRRMTEMEELLASTGDLQRRGATPASTDGGGSQSSSGEPEVSYDVAVLSASVSAPPVT
jgi:hypothetical protein